MSPFALRGPFIALMIQHMAIEANTHEGAKSRTTRIKLCKESTIPGAREKTLRQVLGIRRLQ